jgi:hypothetical protein
MPSVFRQGTEADLDGIERVFRLAFHPPDDAQILDRSVLRWKYFEPRPDWEGSRSFVIDRDGVVVAHAAVWPYELLTRAGPLRGVHLIDWGADAGAPGSGISLVKKILADTGFMCSFGGTDATRAILPKIGFTPANLIHTYARPLRPVSQLLTHQYRNWKLPIRLARNTLWRLVPALSNPKGWALRAVDGASAARAPLPLPRATSIPCARSAGFFSYLEKCPDASFEWFVVSEHGRERGWFCLASLYRQARVVDCWIENATASDYRAMHTLAALASLEATDAVEIVATSCVDECSRGLEGAGYHHVESVPIVISGSATARADSPLDFHMVDCDFAFLHEGHVNYST